MVILLLYDFKVFFLAVVLFEHVILADVGVEYNFVVT